VLRAASLFDLGDAIPAWQGGLLGYLLSTFVYYWWHRARHEVDWLWRGLHQVHHSPSRLEVITSFYKHPIEIAANGILTSLIVYTVLGLNFEAAAFNTLFSALAEFFYHVNVRTPRWLGYLIQRPEMHRVHHEAGAHRYNYGDLPIWDLAFGTFRNPEDQAGPCGFDRDKELAFGPMLLLRDVPFNAIFMGAYRNLVQLYRVGAGLGADAPVPTHVTMLAGGCGGAAAWAVVFPADVLKSRAQVAGAGGGAPLGMLAAGRAVLAEGGVRALYRGCSAALLRSFPANAALLWGVETSDAVLRAWEARGEVAGGS
jgi:hypothetical protein